MARQLDPEESDPAGSVIERALKIERDGAQQLQRSQEQAQHLLAQARAQAAAIARRTDARISRLYGTYLQKVQRDIEKLVQANLPSGERADSAHDRAMLIQAVRRVAAKLTGIA